MTEAEAKALAEWFKVRKGKTLKLNDDGIDCVVEALEKQIPKKMSIGNDNGRQRKCCGNCGVFVLPSSNYCSKCGQKLDWSEM